MADWEDVERLALALPEAVEKSAYGNRAWRVREKLFVWERPLLRGEIEELGEAAPDGEILGARVADEGAKAALIAEEPSIYFTTAHFDGNPAVLVRLGGIPLPDLEGLTVEAWLARAPRRLAHSYLDSR